MKRIIVIGMVLIVISAAIGILIYRHPIQHTVTFEKVALVESDSKTEGQLSGFQRDVATVRLDLTEYRFLFSPTVFEGSIAVNGKEYPVLRPYGDRGIPDFFKNFTSNLERKWHGAKTDAFLLQSDTWSNLENSDDVSLIIGKDFKSFYLYENMKSLDRNNQYAYPARTEAEADELLSMVKY